MLDLAPWRSLRILPNIFENIFQCPAWPDGTAGCAFSAVFGISQKRRVIWFVDEIWPRVIAEMPDCRFLIAGQQSRTGRSCAFPSEGP